MDGRDRKFGDQRAHLAGPVQRRNVGPRLSLDGHRARRRNGIPWVCGPAPRDNPVLASEHSGCDFLYELGRDVRGEPADVPRRVELDDVGANYDAFDTLNESEHVANREAAGLAM